MKDKTNCNSASPDASLDPSIENARGETGPYHSAEDRAARKANKKPSVTSNAPFSTAEYVMVKPGYEDEDEINSQGS